MNSCLFCISFITHFLAYRVIYSEWTITRLVLIVAESHLYHWKAVFNTIAGNYFIEEILPFFWTRNSEICKKAFITYMCTRGEGYTALTKILLIPLRAPNPSPLENFGKKDQNKIFAPEIFYFFFLTPSSPPEPANVCLITKSQQKELWDDKEPLGQDKDGFGCSIFQLWAILHVCNMKTTQTNYSRIQSTSMKNPNLNFKILNWSKKR